MDIGRAIDATTSVVTTENDWRCDFTHGGIRKGCWVQGSADRSVVVTSAMAHFSIFNRASLSAIIIRRRKEIVSCRIDPKKLRTRVW